MKPDPTELSATYPTRPSILTLSQTVINICNKKRHPSKLSTSCRRQHTFEVRQRKKRKKNSQGLDHSSLDKPLVQLPACFPPDKVIITGGNLQQFFQPGVQLKLHIIVWVNLIWTSQPYLNVAVPWANGLDKNCLLFTGDLVTVLPLSKHQLLIPLSPQRWTAQAKPQTQRVLVL